MRALAMKPDLLLLDEPTNHLGIDAIAWLETFLARWNSTLIFVTHDRMFLRRLADRILEIDRGRLFDWSCDYDTFLVRKEAALAAEEKQEEAISQAREKQFEENELLIDDLQHASLEVAPAAMRVEHLVVGRGEQPVAADYRRAERAIAVNSCTAALHLAVEAIGLNRAEVLFRQGQYIVQPDLPARIGYDAAGTVEAIGDGVGRGIRRLEEHLDNGMNRRAWKVGGRPDRRMVGKAAGSR